MTDQINTINIAPTPRILKMLGEIDFKAWQCLCEIVDNSIDAFSLNSDGDYRQGKPQIKIKLPGASQHDLKSTDVLTIEDNGHGMTVETLRDSLKAGFSNNNPVDKMGLFGMGFNISTARLGARTRVVTSTRDSDEILTVTIDFAELEAASSFDIDVERSPKALENNGWHGTKIEITQLRTEHVKPLYQRKRQRDKLGKIYGRVLRERGINIKYDGLPCEPFVHCTWAKERTGNSSLGPVPAVIEIDHKLDEKSFCHTCWVWLSVRETTCPSCGKTDALEVRERRVKGWIGLQRYFDENHYGFDLIRNGRVIKELDKSMFSWLSPDEENELEYPIDGMTKQGRFVGELEIDFVRVTHQKDAFETDSSDWRDAVRVIRGDGPIRPQIGKSLGYPENESPLARLYRAFRTAKKGVANLVPARPNGQAMLNDAVIDDLLFRYNDGQEAYQTDDKWWALVSEINRDSNNDPDGGASGSPFDPDPGPMPTPTTDENSPESESDSSDDSEELGDPDNQLSRNYALNNLFANVSVRVVAHKSKKALGRNGFVVKARGSELTFTYWPKDPIYDNTLLTPADFLINELAFHFHKIAMNELSIIPLTQIELALKEKYFPELLPSTQSLIRSVQAFTDEVKRHLSTKNPSLFDLSLVDQGQVTKVKQSLSRNRGLNEIAIEQAMNDGSFLDFASLSILANILKMSPETIFDDVFFPNTLSHQDDDVDELQSIIRDLIWFEENHQFSGSRLWRARVRRLVGSLEIIESWKL